MAAIGGSMIEVTIRGRIFPATADSDASRSLGGFTKTFEANGDSSVRPIMTREVWSITGISLSIDDSRDDQAFLQEVADSPNNVDLSFKFASLETFAGVGSIVDKIEVSSMNATSALSFSGPGKLERQ